MSDEILTAGAIAPVAWHALPAPEVARRLETEPERGLCAETAEQRLRDHGPNELPSAPGESMLRRIWRQLRSVLVLTLVAAAVVTGVLGHYTDSIIILLVVIVNAVLGLVQEGRAERALASIHALVPQMATVRRDGRVDSIRAEGLVPGDVVLLQPGDRVGADLRLLTARELRIDEALLTGESQPAEKSSEPVPADAVIGDRTSIAFCGTHVTAGHGTGVVVGTGERTEIGRITHLLASVSELQTPLARELDRFARTLTILIGLLAAVTFAVGYFVHGYGVVDLFMAAVALAVSAIPEGLPAIVTIGLAVGVQRMARRNAIVRRLPAVEALGSVTVICSDKTGTLTRNEMTVRTLITPHTVLRVSGVGYEPTGGIEIDGDRADPAHFPAACELARAAVLCSDAELRRDDGGWIAVGDPTEAALVALAMKLELDPESIRRNCPRTDAIPFDSEHRYMATLHHDHSGAGWLWVKGAPERVLEMCDQQGLGANAAPMVHSRWHERMAKVAGRGERLLAIAGRPVGNLREMTCADAEAGLGLLGVVGIVDAPRSEAITAVADCRRAGIKVKMITGDHALTAAAIGRELGIGDGRSVLSGQDIEQLSPHALREAAASRDVFARTSPEHKLRLVEALQAQGEVVAMTGDGVNDAPALRRADIGVSMGEKGTDVARQSAEIVLADDNFASIARAVAEGRAVYDNIRKSILFILPTSFGEALIVVLAIAIGQVLPITPVQILWINMVTTVTLAMALAMERPETGVMIRPPRPPRAPILSGYFLFRIAMVSALMLAGAFGIFLWLQANGYPLPLARTAAVNAVVLFELVYLVNCRFVRDSALHPRHWIANPWVYRAAALLVLLQAIFTYLPPMQRWFGTAALPLESWCLLAAMAVLLFLVVEAEKAVARRWRVGVT